MVTPQRRRKTKNQDFLGKKREESRISPSYWEMVDRLDRSCPEEDGEELLQLEEITPSMDSPLPDNNLFSTATVKKSNSNNHCQCQCSPAKRRSPFSEAPFLPSSSEEMPTAKRQLLLDEQDHAAVFPLRSGYSKIVLPSVDKSPVPGSLSPSEWRSSSSSGLTPQLVFSPSGSALPPLPPLGRTLSDPSSVMTQQGSLNSCKEFPPPASPVVPLPPLHRTTSNSSNLEGSPNSWKGFSFSTSPQPTAMLPPRPPLHRTVSDPTPVALTTMEETPNPKRVKNMLHKVKEEMGKWFEHIMHEAEAKDEAEHSRPENSIVCQDGGEAEAKADEKDEEAVSVEKVGECLSVQFKCPCGKGYKILLSGKECYYKLL